ncbi:hypothetical protein ACFY9N_17035 [Microbacterium sp. NPDC008134]|uniref:hypothetical protein n=1 Tax=Microbacterium sp. NPDC008134 TaxID=3364183 RepID=UPI0036E16395
MRRVTNQTLGGARSSHRPPSFPLSKEKRESNPGSRLVASADDVGMKLVSYAGQQLITTDDVADALVTLAAAIAADGESAALQIPILSDGEKDCADLIAGVGNDILVGPQTSHGDDPDFSEEAANLRAHRLYPKQPDNNANEPEVDDAEDFDLHHGV